ncbi:MAG: PadR family transcriptional regulator [Acidobacteria bacterium RIFCSPLOWO2_02_FULL_67_36]|nr:MAG: PadR family transcriptional regulator [Acidobacteria bacterium RIFCSPLOWO2_02_FULL_67_36]OFW21507.1 MAG: PadR family transcriptional regulator [Acidobacteria bacterium RIFCSPLOWO2_12_FULL_66_21]
MNPRDESRPDLMPGTLDLLILQTLRREEMHGYGIAQRLRDVSDAVLRVEEGSLYPALQRLLLKGWVTGTWAVTENNRRARYYRLTEAGRRELASRTAGYTRLTLAILRVLEAP